MSSIADFLGRHAVLVLLSVTLVTLVVSAVVWRAVHRLAPRGWRWALRGWDAFRNAAFAARLKRVPILAPTVAGTLTIARYLGVVAVSGFLLAAGAVVLFFELADEIGVDESLAAFDVALSAALREHVSHATLRTFAFITHLGDFEFLAGLAALVWAALLVARRWLLANAWLVATVSGGLLNRLLKAIFERSRPVHDHGLVAETSWSFPSGHASGSMLIYGLLCYLVVRHTPSVWHIPVALVSLALIVFVGSSRVLLQVHYLSDVLAGYVSAAAWVTICIAGLEAVRWREGLSLREAKGQPQRSQRTHG